MINFIKRIINEFKIFAIQGNMIDMAVGIIIGAAFGKVIDSLVKDVIMPPLGWLMGKVDFSNLYLTLPNYEGEIIRYPSLQAAKTAGAVTINYGIFISTLINFTIVAFSVFLLIKAINKFRTKFSLDSTEDISSVKTCPRCFSVIDVKATKCPHCTADI